MHKVKYSMFKRTTTNMVKKIQKPKPNKTLTYTETEIYKVIPL